MNLNVADREALAQYVSALQVVKRVSVVATARGLEGGTDFGIDSVMQRITHFVTFFRKSRAKPAGVPQDAAKPRNLHDAR